MNGSRRSPVALAALLPGVGACGRDARAGGMRCGSGERYLPSGLADQPSTDSFGLPGCLCQSDGICAGRALGRLRKQDHVIAAIAGGWDIGINGGASVQQRLLLL